MENDKLERLEKILSPTLARVIDFVKFAEAKNAALLTFSSAWTLALINILNTTPKPIPLLWHWCGMGAIVSFTVAAGFAIRSFLPRSLTDFHIDPEQEKSLIYFKDIALLLNRVLTRTCQDAICQTLVLIRKVISTILQFRLPSIAASQIENFGSLISASWRRPWLFS